MPQYLSRLTIAGSSYIDFLPQPIAHSAAFCASAFASSAFRTTNFQTETRRAVGAEVKLLSPLTFERHLPEGIDGTPGTRRLAAELSNINVNQKLPPPRQLLGVQATGELWDVDADTCIERQTGVITEVSCAPARIQLTIEENGSAPLQALIPKRLVKDLFPSADFSNLNQSGDPAVIIPWGTLYKVPLPLLLRPALQAVFQMVGSAESFIYLDLIGIPDYTVQPGDVLQYDVHWSFPGMFVALDLAATDGTTLRDSGAVDSNGIGAHPATDLSTLAVAKWYRREIPLTALISKTLNRYLVACEANTTGNHIGIIANAQIVSSQGELRLTIINELVSPACSVNASTPAGNTFALTRFDWWLYGPFRTPASGTLTVHSVYRGQAVVNPNEYDVISPLPGLLTIRFFNPPRDTTGAPAVISATVSSTEFGRNPARIKQFLLSDVTDGLGLIVDPATFGGAASVLDTAGIHAEGGLTTQVPAVDVLGALCFHGEHLAVNDAGAYTDTADHAGLHDLHALRIGEGDGFWENGRFLPASFRLLDQPQSLTLKAFLVMDFGGGESYAVSSDRTQAGPGAVLTHEAPYLSPEAVDRETYYRFTRATIAQRYRAEIEAKSFELRSIVPNNLVVVRCPNDPDLDGQTLLVTGRTLSPERLTLRLCGYNPATYTYVSQPVQMTGVPPLVDYRFTIPAPPTSFVIVEEIVERSSDGTVKTFVTLSAAAPSANVTDLRFRARLAGSVLFTEVPVAVTPGEADVRAVIPVEPGLTYHFEVYAFNGGNAPDFRYSEAAQILNHTAAGDATTPAAGTLVLVRQSGAKTVEIECIATFPPDWGVTILYRNTVNNTAGAIEVKRGKTNIFHDQDITYDTTYFYWFKVGDNTYVATNNPANLSAFSPPGTITIQRLLTDDYSDDSIATTKIANLAVTNAKIANLAVTNAKINDLSAQKITTGLLTVHPAAGGATAIFVDSAGKIRLKAMFGTPAALSFEDGSGIERATISGTVGGTLTVTAGGGIVLDAGSSTVGITGNTTLLGANQTQILNPEFSLVTDPSTGALAGYFEIQSIFSSGTFVVPFYHPPA